MPIVRSLGIARLVVGLTLAAWTTPAAMSFATGLHLATRHHHEESVASAVMALAHGHHHELKVPAHRHDATGNSRETLGSPFASSELVPGSLVPSLVHEATSPPVRRAHAPPPPTSLSPLRL